jgi:hypothetical protein
MIMSVDRRVTGPTIPNTHASAAERLSSSATEQGGVLSKRGHAGDMPIERGDFKA